MPTSPAVVDVAARVGGAVGAVVSGAGAVVEQTTGSLGRFVAVGGSFDQYWTPSPPVLPTRKSALPLMVTPLVTLTVTTALFATAPSELSRAPRVGALFQFTVPWLQFGPVV